MSDDSGGPTREHAAKLLREKAEDCRRRAARLTTLCVDLKALAETAELMPLHSAAECALCDLAVQFRPGE
jgi:hypothetical protein